MTANAVLTQVLDDLATIIPAAGPTRGQQRLLRRLLSYENGTRADMARMRAWLNPQNATPTVQHRPEGS